MLPSVEFLCRLQFAMTIMFHYLFPPLTIGLGVVLAYLFWKRWRTGEPEYEAAARFWTGIFALNFAMGVTTGIVMEFQFGTNWAIYSRFVGDVFGSALAAEGIFAFFLESGFLGVLVFGWGRVSPRMHFIAAFMVAIGGMFSAVWIVIANSWQQTPAGFHLVTHDGFARAEITDFWAMVFNPSSMVRLTHVLIGAFVLGAFFVLSISAWYLLRSKHVEFAKRSFVPALYLALIASLGAGLSGDWSCRVVAKHQPAKLAAMEGHYSSAGPADLHLFGFPDSETQTVRYAVGIPGGLSFMLYGDFAQPVTGLDAFPRENWPPVVPVFAAFHLMVGLGTFFVAISAFAVFLHWRGTLFQTRWLLWVFVFTVLGAYAANQLGWITAEIGRQPWVVYNLLRTSEAYSPSLQASHVLASIIAFGLVYGALFLLFVFIMNEKIQKGPVFPASPARPGPGSGVVGAAAAREDKSQARQAHRTD